MKNIFDKDYYYGLRNSNYFNYEYWDNNTYWRPIIKDLKKLKVSGRILDIGCAFGYLLKRAKPLFQEIYGIDISDFAIEKAKGIIPEANLQILDLDKEEIPFPDEYFDVITAFDVLEHTKSIKKSLEKIIPKIRRGGYLLISIPIKDGLVGRVIRFFDKDLSHISVPTRRELGELINKTGMKVIQKGSFSDVILFRIKGIQADYQFILKKN